jgi:hypothetical protein
MPTYRAAAAAAAAARAGAAAPLHLENILTRSFVRSFFAKNEQRRKGCQYVLFEIYIFTLNKPHIETTYHHP